jgi:hypothetical protein
MMDPLLTALFGLAIGFAIGVISAIRCFEKRRGD